MVVPPGIGPTSSRSAPKARKISFRAAGDTGAASEEKSTSEEAVADATTRDLSSNDGAGAPAFCFHLGDVIYYFGEPQYYYDQSSEEDWTNSNQWSPITSTAALIGQPERGSLAGRVAMT
jgi:hypothetical protein